MKFRSLLFSGALVAIFGIAAVGCNDNPITTIITPGAPTAASNLKAVSLSATSVGLTWTKSADTGTITYNVAYKGALSTTDSTMIPISGTTATISGLVTTQGYTFYVRALRNGVESGAVKFSWAPATRYDATTIKIYEKSASGLPSGLWLDAPGGPQAISVTSSTPGNVQLAMNTNAGSPPSFTVGPAFAFGDFTNSANFDKNVFVSKTFYVATSLDTWYTSTPVDSLIGLDNLNVLDIADAGTGAGFFVRTGVTPNLHYARVFIKSVGGQMLQGTGTNRFVELTISYQTTAGLPYAKSAGLRESPIGGYATHRR